MHNLIPFWILDYGIWILDCVPPKGGAECQRHTHSRSLTRVRLQQKELLVIIFRVKKAAIIFHDYGNPLLYFWSRTNFEFEVSKKTTQNVPTSAKAEGTNGTQYPWISRPKQST